MADDKKKKKATTPWGNAMLSGFDEDAPWARPAVKPPNVVPAETTKTKPAPDEDNLGIGWRALTEPGSRFREGGNLPKRKKRPKAETQAEGMKE